MNKQETELQRIRVVGFNEGYNNCKQKIKNDINQRLFYLPESFYDIPECVSIVQVIRKVLDNV